MAEEPTGVRPLARTLGVLVIALDVPDENKVLHRLREQQASLELEIYKTVQRRLGRRFSTEHIRITQGTIEIHVPILTLSASSLITFILVYPKLKANLPILLNDIVKLLQAAGQVVGGFVRPTWIAMSETPGPVLAIYALQLVVIALLVYAIATN